MFDCKVSLFSPLDVISFHRKMGNIGEGSFRQSRNPCNKGLTKNSLYSLAVKTVARKKRVDLSA